MNKYDVKTKNIWNSPLKYILSLIGLLILWINGFGQKNDSSNLFLNDKNSLKNSEVFCNLYARNIEFIDSLKNGIPSIGPDTIYNDSVSIILCTEIMYYDSVPIILYEVFPQLIFFKFYHEFSPGQRNHRGYVNYNRKVYGLSTSFNFLLGQMEYDEEPSLNDKIAAYIQTKKGFSNSIQIIQIKETQEHWGRNDEIYNYRVEAIFNDEKVEFLIAYDNQEFKNIVGFGVFKDRYKVPGY